MAAVTSVAFSPGGERIVSGCGRIIWGEEEDNTVRVWDARSGRVLAVLRGHEDLGEERGLFPDGERIVSATLDKTMRVWDARTGVECPSARARSPGVERGLPLRGPDRQRVRRPDGAACGMPVAGAGGGRSSYAGTMTA